MSEIDLRKMRREELIALLNAVTDENDSLRAANEEADNSCEELKQEIKNANNRNETLKKRIDEIERGRSDAEQELAVLNANFVTASEHICKVEEIEREIAQVREQIAEVKRQRRTQGASSIADAVLKANNFYEVAQKTADEYLATVKAVNERKLAELEAYDPGAKAQQMIEEANSRKEDLLKDASQWCDIQQTKNEKAITELQQQADEECENAKAEAEFFQRESWQHVSVYLADFCSKNQEIMSLLGRSAS